LSESLCFGFKVSHSGLLLKDFHTIYVPPDDKKAKYRHTRRDEMHLEKFNPPVLSRREYRQDAFALVAVWLTENSTYSLATLEQKLKQPEFQLYLGRKSCPFSLPLNPKIITADNFRTALDEYKLPSELKFLGKESSIYYWEKSPLSGEDAYNYRVPRYDQPLNRKQWQFTSRDEYVLLPTEGERHVS
jgi:CRISPR system Cascade subunit CasD